MFNYLKRTSLKIGGMAVEQTAQPHGDGELIHVMHTITVGHRVYVCGSLIRFEDVEKLADEKFRIELARRDLTGLVKELRETTEATEKALAAT